MKSNNFVCTTVFILIAQFTSWIAKPSKLIQWWHTFLDWRHQRQRRRRIKRSPSNTMYEFRPFELQRYDYKGYSRDKHSGRGIKFIPKARSGHRIVANETDIFCFGGYNPESENLLFQELLKFNVLNRKWSKVFRQHTDRMPTESVSNAIAIKGDTLVVFGGTGFPFGRERSNKTYLMWPSVRHIRLLETTGNQPEQLYGQAILLRDNYLYVIGGTTGHEFLCDIYRLDLGTRVWECCYTCNENIRDDPKGRYRHEVAHDDNYVYILGGGTQDQSFDLEIVPAYSFDENKWIYVKTLPDPNTEANGGYPEPRRFHSCIQQHTDHGTEAIIAGGFKAQDKCFDDIWKLNLKTYQWQRFTLTKLPYTLYFHDATATENGQMFVFGGVTGNNGNLRTNDLHRMWTKIPKLSEICWEALLHYNPQLKDKDLMELLTMGVPRNLAGRIVHGQHCEIGISDLPPNVDPTNQ